LDWILLVILPMVLVTATAEASDGLRFTKATGEKAHLAYGIDIAPPWPDGGTLTWNLPEHLEWMPGTQGILRHNDPEPNGHWQILDDGARIVLDVESATMPGAFVKAEGKVVSDNRIEMTFAITNKSETVLGAIRPLYCLHYAGLTDFPGAWRSPEGQGRCDNFDHIFTVSDSNAVTLASLPVEKPEIVRRAATVRGSSQDDYTGFKFTEGGVVEEGLDRAIIGVTSRDGKRNFVFGWTPGKSMLSNAYIPCVHADPFYGDIPPGETREARAILIFTEGPVEEAIKTLVDEGVGLPFGAEE
jgi:hypothetical protein